MPATEQTQPAGIPIEAGSLNVKASAGWMQNEWRAGSNCTLEAWKL